MVFLLKIMVDIMGLNKKTDCMNEKFSGFFKILSIDLLHLVFNEPQKKVNNQRTSKVRLLPGISKQVRDTTRCVNSDLVFKGMIQKRGSFPRRGVGRTHLFLI